MISCDLEKIKKRLPKVPGIQGRDEFLNSVVLVPLVEINGEYCMLFEKRSPNIRQGGEVCFPGGVHDPDDADLKRTALRETFEEIGIGEDRITILGALDTIVAPVGTIVDGFLGVLNIDSLDDIAINNDEVDYVFTVPLSYFESREPELYHARTFVHPFYTDENGRKVTLFPSKELGMPEAYWKPWGGRKYRIYVYRYNNEIIWGMTARFVYDLVNKLK